MGLVGVSSGNRDDILRDRMILAGIDEAGYGPLLGPLVVGCCAFEVQAEPSGPLPCLWKRLARCISKKRVRSGKKIHVNDSKAVYTPAQGVRELERAVLSLAAATRGPCDDFDGFVRSVASHVLDDVDQYAWYAPTPGPFPIANNAMALRLLGNALRVEMRRTETRAEYLGARVVLERQFNRMLQSTRNKASTLFSISAMHLDYLFRNYAHKGLVIFCDRQGGRAHYGSLLRLMFEDWSLEVISEIENRSEYRLSRCGNGVRVIFCEKAEGLCLPVAVASMLSKYLRELLMHRFNAFWKQHIPDLAPTAGYYTDGKRFLREIHQKRVEMDIPDEQIVRCR